MTSTKKGEFWYGTEQSDIRPELTRYSQANGYVARHFADCKCACGGTTFGLFVDDTEGAAERKCIDCGATHLIGDSAEYIDDAELEECGCPCGNDGFEITVGVALYEPAPDVRWLYLGCRCPACGLTACYADWKCDGGPHQALLASA